MCIDSYLNTIICGDCLEVIRGFWMVVLLCSLLRRLILF